MQRVEYSKSCLLLVSLVLLSWPLLTSQSPQTPSSSQSTTAACKSTPYPKLCRTILGAFKSSPSDPFRYGKFTVKQCLKQARRLSKAFHRFAQLVEANQAISTPEEVGAVADCGELADLSVDYLETVEEELKGAEVMTEALVERVTSLLSGVVTNQQTCLDGLDEAKSQFAAAAMGTPLGNLTRLYSVSLGLVTHALNKNLKRYKGSRKNIFGGSHNVVREPLETLIKVLRKTCDKEKECGRKIERRTGELGQTSGGSVLVREAVTVGPYETDNFTTISAAVAAAPNNTNPEDGYFVIYAREGLYEEYVVVSKNKRNVLLIGDGINRTVISGNHSFVDGWTTYNSSTFAVAGERFVAVDVTFRNTAGPQKHQAVALRSNADWSTFYRCSFEGYQDTLYVHSLRQFYRQCDIYGTIDFIFGNAAAVFQNCNLYARKPMDKQKNAFTAQGRTDPNQNTGISIQNCTIQAAADLAADQNSTWTFLGRPWKPYSRTVYMQSYISDVVHPLGWLEWNGTVGLDTLYYGEYENFGPGSNTGSRVQWPGYSLMNLTQALNFTVYNLTVGDTWLPQTDIPFYGGLVSQRVV
ncbi:PREDICTED: probable pectinesterase/pectinesterase inhibitor 47 isoform X1 [Tarenaya hassleriana]|uniref:probable pectinesterase/pectinesterase inhibitor 47 isoform X2 n=1 Tax=Tarenaya hassleriana TaxID=28532 RepID=UPI00053C5553|nr:PREDICTED: probable pectinesterase/pectinesterase inhibitor 47 isoform X2 [Tarenaya hassleriana]XP_010558234.1 PREDICTED: probable pectinesterase/pectinesterase inhibitor 47 isoform X1 [Tarenaya hassleriana]